MGFYEQISKYYDYIFPTGEEQVDFISECAGAPGNKVLDVACGAGGYSERLAQSEYKMTAVDIDSAMVKIAQEKLASIDREAKVFQSDMKQLGNVINQKFNCVFCIGNSIVHLGSSKDISMALEQMYGLLEPDGVLALQIINFDRILKYRVTELPTLHNEEAGIEFAREYHYIKEKGIIEFKTALSVDEDGKKQVFENSIELLPLVSSELRELLKNNGFKDIEFYGDFKKSVYDDKSYLLVVKAGK